ncbi:MAG: TSCPD domain-containing protein, partial [Peptococcaceae bacterium]|nr:TSCPD domain-containing protein [Peptococcaceae bacterium]
TARLISVALRSGLSVEVITEQIRGIRCPACIRREGVNVTSCPDAISRVIKKYMDVDSASSSKTSATPGSGEKENGIGQSLQRLSTLAAKSGASNLPANGLKKKARTSLAVDNACPECGMSINHESGCIVCIHCGYSKCG